MTRLSGLLIAALASATVSASVALMSSPSAHAAVPSSSASSSGVAVPSIFHTAAPALDGAGWAACPAPITWTLDVSALPAGRVSPAIAIVQAAFDQWSSATGLTFAFAGTQAMTYDPATSTLLPADGSTAPVRHISLAFVRAREAGFAPNLEGLARPTLVMPTGGVIVQGDAVMRADLFASARTPGNTLRTLVEHELGHVLGLSHADQPGDVMSAVLTRQATFTPVDATSARALTHPCGTTA